MVLRRNYRSHAPVLSAAHRLIRFNDPDRLEVRAGVSKRLKAERVAATPAPVRLEAFATAGDEVDWIAAEIGRRIASGAAPRDHAVLVRANGHADALLRALNLAGIPWRFSGTSGLYARPEVRLLLAFLRTVADPTSSVDLYALAASEVYDIDGEDLTDIVDLRPPAEPLRARRPRGAGRAAGDPSGLGRRRGPRSPGWSRTCARTPSCPTSARRASCCTRSCAAAGCWRA